MQPKKKVEVDLEQTNSFALDDVSWRFRLSQGLWLFPLARFRPALDRPCTRISRSQVLTFLRKRGPRSCERRRSATLRASGERRAVVATFRDETRNCAAPARLLSRLFRTLLWTNSGYVVDIIALLEGKETRRARKWWKIREKMKKGLVSPPKRGSWKSRPNCISRLLARLAPVLLEPLHPRSDAERRFSCDCRAERERTRTEARPAGEAQTEKK